MATFTVTVNSKDNQPPNQIGNNLIGLDHNTEYVFTIDDFTTNTTPSYSDPEDDPASSIRILALPDIGNLEFNNTPITIVPRDVTSVELLAGLLTYQADPLNTDGYISGTFKFDVADSGSLQYSGLEAFMTFKVAPVSNSPATEVGDNSVTIEYGEVIVFTSADFTTNTTPAYSDPENDNPALLRIDSLPSSGTLLLNNVPVVINQVILFSDIAAGNLTFENDPTDTDGETTNFNFSIADSGSGIFVS